MHWLHRTNSIRSSFSWRCQVRGIKKGPRARPADAQPLQIPTVRSLCKSLCNLRRGPEPVAISGDHHHRDLLLLSVPAHVKKTDAVPDGTPVIPLQAAPAVAGPFASHLAPIHPVHIKRRVIISFPTLSNVHTYVGPHGGPRISAGSRGAHGPLFNRSPGSFESQMRSESGGEPESAEINFNLA